MKKSTVIVIAMVLVTVLALAFLISQGTTYNPPRHLTWNYSYETTNGDPLIPDNVWFSVYEVVDTGYVKLGATQDTTYDLLTMNPELYDNQNHTWVVTAWDDASQKESFYSESVSEILPTAPIRTVENLQINN